MFEETSQDAWKQPDRPEYRLEAPDPLMTPEQDTLPEGTNPERPLQIWIRKDHLLDAIEASLVSIGTLRTGLDHNLDDLEDTDALIYQRWQFRDRLKAHRLDHVYVNVVPQRTVGLADEANDS